MKQSVLHHMNSFPFTKQVQNTEYFIYPITGNCSIDLHTKAHKNNNNNKQQKQPTNQN